MEESTFISLSQRSSAFWLGLGLLLAGGIIPDSIQVGSAHLNGVIIGLGATILLVRLLVAGYIILRTSYEGWRYGYAEGKLSG